MMLSCVWGGEGGLGIAVVVVFLPPESGGSK